MKLENMNQDFPNMPESMRQMIEQEVEKQLAKPDVLPGSRKTGRHISKKRLAIAVAAATLALGTTVFAGVLYGLKNNRVGKYAYETKLERQDGAQDGTVASADSEHYVKVQASYLPDGMVQTEEGKYNYRDGRGGVTIGCYYMDTGDTSFEKLSYNVTEKEELKVNGRDGVYLKTALEAYNQSLYVTYPEEHLVLEMLASSDISKEEALKIAQGVTVTPTEETVGDDVMLCYNWSKYLDAEKENALAEESSDSVEVTFSQKLLEKAERIGRIMDMENNGLEKLPGLTAKVTDVQTADNQSILPEGMLDAEAATAFDANGNLKSSTISYIKKGDGIDTLDQVVKTEKSENKLVYVTVEYTNTGSDTLTDIMYNGSIQLLETKGDRASVWHRELETPAAGDEWDYVVEEGLMLTAEVGAYDVRGGERGNNYIDTLKPGETVTVHEAFAVPADKLGEMYLNLDGTGEAQSALENGWMVDIRK